MPKEIDAALSNPEPPNWRNFQIWDFLELSSFWHNLIISASICPAKAGASPIVELTWAASGLPSFHPFFPLHDAHARTSLRLCTVPSGFDSGELHNWTNTDPTNRRSLVQLLYRRLIPALDLRRILHYRPLRNKALIRTLLCQSLDHNLWASLVYTSAIPSCIGLCSHIHNSLHGNSFVRQQDQRH